MTLHDEVRIEWQFPGLLHGCELADRGFCMLRNSDKCSYNDYKIQVEIEDMDWNEDLQAFTYQCPCGDLFQITPEELAAGTYIHTISRL